MNTISRRITNEKRFIQVKASNVISALTIIFLSCVVVVFTILNLDMITKIRKTSQHTVVYNSVAKEEEPTVLKIDF